MNGLPLISVVIPNYNYGRYLRECIDSVSAQTYSRVETIVVDDGSTDDSVAILKSYGNKIRLIQQANRGVSAARNRGIEESQGELIAFLDSDDLWAPDKLILQSAAMEDPRVGMVYTGLEYISADSKPLGQSTRGDSGDVLSNLVAMQPPGVPATGSSPLVRRDCLQVVGNFDTRLSTSADWELWSRIAARYEVAFLSQPLTRYRLHGKGMHLNALALEQDNLLALSKIFDDPAAQRAHHLKRRSYAKLYLILGGTHFHAGNYRRAIWMVMRSSALWPPNALYVLGFPLRYWNRTFSDQRSIRTD